jgi:hypothetical protein
MRVSVLIFEPNLFYSAQEGQMLDDIDREILRLAKQRPLPGSISDLTRPLQGRLAANRLNLRVHDLEAQGLLKLSKQRHYVFVEITERGQMATQSSEGGGAR